MSALYQVFVLIVRPLSRLLANSTGVMVWALRSTNANPVEMGRSFFAQNGRYAAGALLLVLAQFALIVALLVQRLRRAAGK